MYLVPKVEDVEELFHSGKKDLSEAHVAKLNRMITQLEKVKGDDKALALFNIARIYEYLNSFALASQFYLDSYSLDKDEVAYANYINTYYLIAPEHALEQGIHFLESNPNNFRVLEILLNMLTQVSCEEILSKIQKYMEYHTYNSKAYSKLLYLYEIATKAQTRSMLTGKSLLKINKLAVLSIIEFIKIYNIQPYFECNFDYVEECYFFNIANVPKYDDLITLNQNYDLSIENAIKNGEFSFKEYLDVTRNFVVSFSSFHPEQVDVA